MTELINSNENNALTDSKSLELLFHSHGVNMRYLGKVISHVNRKDHPHVYICLQRVILVKSLKHVFREAMRESEDVFLSTNLAHLLNCIFSPIKTLNELNDGTLKIDYLQYLDFTENDLLDKN